MAVKSYGSVNGVSKEITKLYGSVNGVSKEIKKLYASVNGVSKLIYEAAASVDYGTVYYKTSSSSSTILSVELQSQAEFESLTGWAGDSSVPAPTLNSWTASVGGGSVTVSNGYNSTDSNVIVGVRIGADITSIPIGFLYNCHRLSEPLTIPESVTSIGVYFIANCDNFTGAVNVGSVAATVADSSTYTFSSRSKGVASYSTGIAITGANRAAWLSRFASRTSSRPYRKTTDGGA